MIKLIMFIITGCWHKWETIHKGRLTGDGGAVGMRFTLKCTRCGKIKKRDLI